VGAWRTSIGTSLTTQVRNPNRPRTADRTDAGERPVDRFRRSATGAVVAAGLFGLRDALEGRPEKEEVTIVNEAPDAPPRDLEVVIDFDHPERSVAVVHHPEDDGGTSDG
jgi:hypothetical protein